VAKAIVELGHNTIGESSETLQAHCCFYHVINPHGFSWTDDLLPELHGAGLSFEVVSPQEWIERLRMSKQNPELNPTIKLMSIYENRYSKEGGEQYEGQNSFNIRFDTTNAKTASQSMRTSPDIIRGGYVKKFVARWLEKWQDVPPSKI
jgi:hypothetical protein